MLAFAYILPNNDISKGGIPLCCTCIPFMSFYFSFLVWFCLHSAVAKKVPYGSTMPQQLPCLLLMISPNFFLMNRGSCTNAHVVQPLGNVSQHAHTCARLRTNRLETCGFKVANIESKNDIISYYTSTLPMKALSLR